MKEKTLIEKVIQSEFNALNKIAPEISNDMSDFTEEEMNDQEISAKAAIKTVLEQMIKWCLVSYVPSDFSKAVLRFAHFNNILLSGLWYDKEEREELENHYTEEEIQTLIDKDILDEDNLTDKEKEILNTITGKS